MKILSIQSHVAMGHVGNSAAVPVWYAQNIEVWPVSTVQFSSHAGWPDWAGHVTTPEQLDAILGALVHRWAQDPCDAIVSGYLGQPEHARVIAKFVQTIRDAHGVDVPFLCDPVLGDGGRYYVEPRIGEEMVKWLLPLATIICPNHSELGWISGCPITSWDDVMKATQTLATGHDCRVVLKGVKQQDALHLLSVSPDGMDAHIQTPYHDMYYAGCGDVFAALYMALMLKHDTQETKRLRECAALLDDLIQYSSQRQSKSLALINWLQRSP